MRFFVYFFCFLLPGVFGVAAIRECASIREVAAEGSPNTVVVFDIDNTVLRPAQMLGSDEWFGWYSTFRPNQDLPPAIEKRERCLDLLSGIYAMTQVLPMEHCTAETIRHLQEKGVFVVAMTSRGPHMATVTFRHLQSVGVNFTTAPVVAKKFFLKNDHARAYVAGVLFTSAQHKGEALNDFFCHIGFSPRRVVYLNDHRAPLEEASVLEKKGIEFLGLRYQVADKYVQSFNPEVAEIELMEFSKILSDEKAKHILNQKRAAAW